jgi:hypothetical protein
MAQDMANKNVQILAFMSADDSLEVDPAPVASSFGSHI